MPRRKSAQSLKHTCLIAVARNMDFWCTNYVENFPKKNVLYVVGPFDDLPQGLQMEILKILKKKKLLRRPHIDLLINSEVDRIDLSYNATVDLNYVLNRLTQVCQNLRHLDLSYCNKISQNAFLHLAKAIPLVQSLDLRSTGCSDEVLTALGSHCHELRELDISWCPITDTGISGLCINIDDMHCRTQRRNKISSLSVQGTYITHEGAICALKHLACLSSFSFPNTCKALEIMHKNDLQDNQLNKVPKYPLQMLCSNCDYNTPEVTFESIEIAITLCPFVSKVMIANGNISNETLLLISNFSHLQELQLGNGSDSNISFEEGIVPLLQTRGSQLQALSLAEIPGVDVSLIGLCCPRIQNLDLLQTPYYSFLSLELPQSSKERAFEYLKSLRIVCTEEGDIPAAQVREMLSHCYELESVFIQRCQSLTDSLLSDVLNSNPMPRLKHMELEYCNTLTAAGIMTLLSSDNTLNSLKMRWCQGITRRDYDFFCELVRQENLDISVEWIYEVITLIPRTRSFSRFIKYNS